MGELPKETIDKLRKGEETDRDAKILQMYLSCHTEEEIGNELDMPRRTVNDAIERLGENSEIVKIANEPPSSLQITTL
jgi:DNA-binding transcriptional regulator LsrR (DeoR family)